MSRGFSPAVLKALKKRSGGICEGCGVSKATEAHHRQYRSRGGSDDLNNALHLCGSGNHTGCHGIAHTADGEARGWSVRSGFDPAEVPARIVAGFSQVWVRFEFAEFPTLMNPNDAVEYMALIGAVKRVS
jgi:hypothetical protein